MHNSAKYWDGNWELPVPEHWRIQGGHKESAPPLDPIRFHFYAGFGKIGQNNRFAPLLLGLVPPPPTQENPESATA